jgi:ABC-type Fe3+-hydroxamate transport system substrate-binding protein
VRNAAVGRAPVRYAYLIWRDPWMTISDDTFVSALLALPGGRNVFGAGHDRYPAVTVEDLRAADPDLVLLASEPFPFRDIHADELAASSGIERSRFALVDGELLSWHGSRTPRGIDYAERIVAGDTIDRTGSPS